MDVGRLLPLPDEFAQSCLTIREHWAQAVAESEPITLQQVESQSLVELVRFKEPAGWLVERSTWAQARRLGEVALYLDCQPFLQAVSTKLWSVLSLELAFTDAHAVDLNAAMLTAAYSKAARSSRLIIERARTRTPVCTHARIRPTIYWIGSFRSSSAGRLS